MTSLNTPTDSIGSETAVLYVLDAAFIRPLRVLHESLKRHNTLQNCPVVVITNDPIAAKDRYIRSIAHSVELVDASTLRQLGRIRGDRIAASLSVDFAPKYTFLKLLMFKERGFKRHIFMDADMLCMQPLDEELLAGPAAVKAVREFGASLFPIRDEPRAATFPDAGLRYIEEHSTPLRCPIPQINSGFVVLQGAAISEQLFEAAIELGATVAFPSEQTLTTEIIKRRRLDFLRLPIWYNARKRLFTSLGESFYADAQRRIHLLHYTPGKPWKVPSSIHGTWDRQWLQLESLMPP